MKTGMRKKLKKGSALVVTFAVVILVAAVCSGMHAYSSQQFLMTVKTRDFLKAKVIAEAGINQAYNQLKYNFAAKDNPLLFLETAFSDGAYDVDVFTVGTNTARLVSAGKYGMAAATVKVDLLNQEKTKVTDDPEITPFGFTNFLFLAGGMIDWGGGLVVLNSAKIKTNNRIQMIGFGYMSGADLIALAAQQIYIQGSAKIMGEAHAPRFEGKTDSIVTKVTEAVPFETIPLLDLAAYYQYARSHNEVKSGTFLLNSDYNPQGGIVWVNGDIKITGGNFTGCFIATGNIEISTSETMTSINGFPLLISRDGTIKITSTPTLDGLIYARGGSVEWTGGGQLTGSIIAAGDLIKGGGSVLQVYFEPFFPVAPDTLAMTDLADHVIISAWQE